jgi:hypothetical protein
MRDGWDGNGPRSASRTEAAKGQDPKSAAGWTIVRPGCAAERRSGPKLRHLQDVSRWNGPCQSAELPWAAGQHGGTGRKGRTAAARVSIASTARPRAHSAHRQGGRHVRVGCSTCTGCASSERCRGQKPHERRPGNLPSDTVGKMPGPAMRSVRCPIRTARWGTHDAEAQRQACVDGLRTHRALFQPSPAVLTRFR